MFSMKGLNKIEKIKMSIALLYKMHVITWELGENDKKGGIFNFFTDGKNRYEKKKNKTTMTNPLQNSSSLLCCSFKNILLIEKF